MKVYFDKQASTGDINASMFTVKDDVTDEVYGFTMSYNSGTGYSGIADSAMNKGTTVTLSLTNALKYDRLYKVTISNLLRDNNGISLGNYKNRRDLTFKIRTPRSASDGSYSAAPVVTYTIPNTTSNDTYAAYEDNLGAIFDRPLDATFVANDLLDTTDAVYGMTSNYTRNGVAVVYDSVIDASYVTGAENYKAFGNQANTYFFFPECVNSNSYAIYNRVYDAGSKKYTLSIPSVQDVYGTWWTINSSVTFETVDSDLPGWMESAPVDNGSSDGILRITWDAPPASYGATPSGYNVYVSDSEYAQYTLLNTEGLITSGTSYSKDVGAGDYYVRVVPVKNNIVNGSYPGSSGFSRVVLVTVTP
ncbi:MAG: hypothetical protein A4E52_01751 [Pelotomaculum sp. PtaB.Bin013]|nr:MAG: hypothetical protein A4E52_01751 [Pelotomaculum sp. PtaB.Bin013]